MIRNHFSKFEVLCSFVFCFVWFSVPVVAWAAVLYLEPSEGYYYRGDTFLVAVRMDTEGECVNTIEANLIFPKDILEAVDFGRGGSILTMWLQPPVINQKSGQISFTGGIPGGFCGILPGDPGKSNLLGRIAFEAKKSSGEASGEQISAEVSVIVEFLINSQVLLNDGFGTPAILTLKEAAFNILPQITATSRNQWQEELKKDTIPPEPFLIEIHRDPAIFDGKYFIIFSTADKQTGIDYYEIMERKISPIFYILYPKFSWIRSESPYLLKDQSLKSIIKVKAKDMAGNVRVAEYRPPKRPFPWWVIIPVLSGIAIWWIFRKKKIESRK